MERLKGLGAALGQELESILTFWSVKMKDPVQGGFFGAMDHAGNIHTDAPKGTVLNARILWTFSSAAKLLQNEGYAILAHEFYPWFTGKFFDVNFGGVYWSVSSSGKPLDTKKQIYAQAFSIYALAAYFGISQNRDALNKAIGLYHCIEKYSFDEKDGGYLEAFTQDWQPLDDLRLSEKDANEKKTMNTHLHVLEGYTLLYKYWPDAGLGQKIAGLLEIFRDKILQMETQTQGLFFSEKWERKDHLVSYGHDIEAAWLLQEAAEVLGNEAWIDWARQTAINLAESSLKGMDADGGLWYEMDLRQNHLVKEKHWWPQAEAMVGYFNAWQVSGHGRFLEQVFNTWQFIRAHLLDQDLGEWKWGVRQDYSVMDTEDFAGFWKCPYHNGRCCMELIKRIGDLGQGG